MIYPKTKQTAEAVAQHYNSLDQFYRQLWGEHVHHGLWKTGNESVEQATEQLIEKVVEAGKIDEHSYVLDVGCGYGATARLLASRWEAQVTALTLSKSQWEYARAHDPESSNPQYLLGDFLNNHLKSESFDVIISVESSEHMVDKKKFFEEVMRLLKPKGRFVTCAWLAKNAPKDWEVEHLLEPICREGRLPNMGSENEYRQMMEEVGLKEIHFEDLSDSVKKTWAICAYRMSKAFFKDKRLRDYLMKKSSSDRIFAKSLFRIWLAYQTKSMVYGLFSAVKE
jgi:tocopherol O-methyltransferase